MDDIDSLQRQASESRAAFVQAASDFRRHLTFTNVARTVVAVLETRRHAPGRTGRSARLALAVAAALSAGRDLKSFWSTPRQGRPTRRQYMRKETIHANHN